MTVSHGEMMVISLRHVRVTGWEAIVLASELLQWAHLSDPEAGLWDAADVQWSWRMPRPSDDVDQLFWLDDGGPVAAALLLTWSADVWHLLPVAIAEAGPERGEVWRRGLEHVATIPSVREIRVLVADGDGAFTELVEQSGFTADEQEASAYLDVAERPAVAEPPAGFVVVDRTQRPDAPHPMRPRNGEGVAGRLARCPLYDPVLDLAVETEEGRVAGYSLGWFDPVTRMGIVEPVRVEEDFRRRGLARVMLSVGIDRLAAKGAQRVKVTYYSEPAAALYKRIGFRETSTATWFVRQV